ncbi:MAG TPA: hypothetical protein VGQ83_18830 [Polyangia bacterium]
MSLTLAPLAVRCGARLHLASHSLVLQVGDDGTVVEHETGWGPDPGGLEQGWSFSYTHCWKAETAAAPPAAGQEDPAPSRGGRR